jgi:uncharacterized protein YegP (UPF0339 family)
MPASFEIGKSKDGQYKFVLKAANGEVILASELYKSKSSATNGIASVRTNCAVDARYERKMTKNGKWMFNLKAGNHQVIGTSEMYNSEKARDGGIASVKKNGSTSAVADKT